MKKKGTVLIALLLAVSILTGCGAAETALGSLFESSREDYAARELCRFADMPYERPDTAAFTEKADAVLAALEEGAGYRKVTGMLDELYALYDSADTMFTIADIRNCQDMTDEYYAAEYAACRNATMSINRDMERVYLACGSSKHASRLARDYFWDGFLDEYGPDAEETLTEDYMVLANREGDLIARYRALVSNPTVEQHGEELPLHEALDTARDEQEYYALYSAYYERYNRLLGELYLELVQVRKEEAELLGFDSYADMAYAFSYDRDFTVEEGRAFAESVKDHLVPLYLKAGDSELQARLLERYVPEEELYDTLEAVAYGLGGEVREAYDFMRKYELCDIAMSDVKPDMSFETYLCDYAAPFLFASPYGDLSDLVTVTHEFGHYVDSYVSFNAYRSMDLAEVFSQAMQFLSLGELRDVLGKRGVDNLRRLNLLEALDTYVQQVSFMEFEDRVFALEDPTVEDLNALSLQLAKDYGYYDGVSEDYYALSWIDIPHFFEQAFYVISYPVSLGAALEIYERELNEPGAGLDAFMKLIDCEQTGIVGAVEEAGLQNPLTDARVQEIASFLESQLAA